MAVAKNKTAAPSAARRGASDRAGDGSAGNANADSADFTREEEIKAYSDMLMIRRFEEKAGQMYGMGLIGGFCPVSYTHLTLPTKRIV